MPAAIYPIRQLMRYGSLAALLFLSSCAHMNQDLRLIRAAEEGNASLVRRLIEQGADINASDHDGWTPFLAASSKGHLQVIEELKRAGANQHVPF